MRNYPLRQVVADELATIAVLNLARPTDGSALATCSVRLGVVTFDDITIVQGTDGRLVTHPHRLGGAARAAIEAAALWAYDFKKGTLE